jgi:hypothetical protein
LFTSFSRVPAPASPTQIVRWPSAPNSGAIRARLAGPGCEDRQLAAFRRILAARHRRVQEHHIRTLSTGQGCDAVDPGHADGAHLGPDPTRRQGSEHALVPGDRDDGIGVGHHRDHDHGSPRRVGRGPGDLGAALS